jgi:broad specificity phosphatase PhoE
MTSLYLIRHGQTDWNIEQRWQGQSDIPLNATGHQQAARVAAELVTANFSAIYSSDLSRAYETALALSRISGLPVQREPRLREIHQGEWQGLREIDIQSRYGNAFQERKQQPLHIAPPGGETVVQVRDRVVSAVNDICIMHPDERVALVSHGFALALIQVHFSQMPIETAWQIIPANAEWRELEIDGSTINPIS